MVIGRLRAEPAPAITNAAGARALAAALARRESDLYRDLSARMAQLGRGGAAAAFAEAAAGEALTDGAAGTRAFEAGVAKVPAIFEHEDIGASRFATAYDAWALAARNADRAFAFWAYASAHAANAGLRTQVERLARAARGQAADRRAARREAFHAADGETGAFAPPGMPTRDALRAATLVMLHSEAARREAALAALQGHAAQALAAVGHPAAPDLAQVAREAASLAAALGSGPDAKIGEPEPPPDGIEPLLASATASLEGLVEFYLAVAGAARSEDAALAAQGLARHAIGRLKRLR